MPATPVAPNLLAPKPDITKDDPIVEATATAIPLSTTMRVSPIKITNTANRRGKTVTIRAGVGFCRRRAVNAHIFSYSIPEIRHTSAYQQAEQIKEPHAEGNIRIDQIARTEHGETESEEQSRSFFEDRDALVWDCGIVEVKPLQALIRKAMPKPNHMSRLLNRGLSPDCPLGAVISIGSCASG